MIPDNVGTKEHQEHLLKIIEIFKSIQPQIEEFNKSLNERIIKDLQNEVAIK